jgi:peptide/nickel transport system ATP-binding protein
MSALSADRGPRAGTSQAALLDVRDLHVTYRRAGYEVPAVRGVSFALGRGQTLGVAGESGSGKSTMALSLLRLAGPSATVTGQVVYDGEDLLTARWSRLRAVRWSKASMVFQGAMSALNPVRTVLEQIVEPIVLHEKAGRREAERRAAHLLDSVGIPAARLRSYPHEFSGGQRQRVMIAMALACDPDLVIADEPTTALDVMVQAQVLGLLADLVRDSRIAVIMISHDLSVLAHACERLAVMYAGRIVELGPSHEVIADPRHPYTTALARAFPTIGDPASRLAPSGLAGDPPRPSDLAEGCSFAPRCAHVVDACRTRETELWDAGPGRSAACLRVLPGAAAEAGAGAGAAANVARAADDGHDQDGDR